MHRFAISICGIAAQFNEGKERKELGQLKSLSLIVQEVTAKSVVIIEKNSNMLGKSYISCSCFYR